MKPEDFIIYDDKKISWSRALRNDLKKHKRHEFKRNAFAIGLYRPFIKQHLYFDRNFINDFAQMHLAFPSSAEDNLIICVSGIGARAGFSTLISDQIPNLHTLDTSQCFPLYLYEKAKDNTADSDDLFAQADPRPHTPSPEPHTGYTRKDGISDAGLAHFQKSYPGETISKEDLFYYIYGLLHSPEYRSRYADNLSKELPRIPAVKKAADFWAYSKAGRDLAHWHLNYETVEMYMGCRVLGVGYGKLGDGVLGMGDGVLGMGYGTKTSHPIPHTLSPNLKPEDYRVTKMKFAKVKDPETGKSVADKTTVIYNPKITVKDIPLEAYDYIVNGKPAIEWVMERQAVTIDKKSGIKNDANLWATETMGNAKYPLELLLRVITVSLETNKIVNSLPELEID
ncbi:MAG: type ISP restriction/modification enzyme [Opitutales bacterium]